MIVDHLASPAVAGFSVSKIRGQGPRDSSSGSGTGRSNRTPANHPVTDTPIVPTSHYQRG